MKQQQQLNRLRRIIREEIQHSLQEQDENIKIPGITDDKIEANLNLAMRFVSTSIRQKLKDLIGDENAAKDLTTPGQRVAVITAICVAFGINEQAFTAIIGDVKDNLESAKSANVEV